MTQRGQAQLCGRRGSSAVQLLDVGRDVNALDVGELRHALRREPVEKLRRRARVGAARVRVANLGGEEFEEAIGSTGASRSDKGRSTRGSDGRELVHPHIRFASKFNLAAFSSFTSLSFQPSALSISV